MNNIFFLVVSMHTRHLLIFILGFLKRCKKFFTAADVRSVHIAYMSPKLERESYVCAEAPKIPFAHASLSKTVDTIEYRHNVDYVVLMCRCVQGNCSTEKKGIGPPTKSFPRIAKLSQYFRHDCSLCIYTLSLWNVRAVIFLSQPYTSTTCSFYPSLPTTLFARTYRALPLIGWSTQKQKQIATCAIRRHLSY